MEHPDLPRINAEIAALMRERLGARGVTLDDRLRRLGRQLPRKIRAAGAVLTQAEALWDNPKLRRQIDPDAVAEAETRLRDYLTAIDPADRRRGYWVGVLAPLAFNILLLLALVTVFLVWSDRV